MDTIALTELIKMDKKIRDLFDNEFEIAILSKKFNIIYKIFNANRTIYAKVGFRGWSYSEWEVLNLLFQKKFIVPPPIHYIPLSTVRIESWRFGDLKQENGIIFYEPLLGKDLLEILNEENIKEACALLNKLHNDIDFKNHVMPKYQEFEVQRGLKYAKDLYSGSKLDKIEIMMKNYLKHEIKPTFIHGDARIEHFIVTLKGIGMFDFEGACYGDPFKDFGAFKGDLAFHDIDLYPVIEKLFDRELSKVEIERIEFFELRKLLVSIKYGNNEKAKEIVEGKL